MLRPLLVALVCFVASFCSAQTTSAQDAAFTGKVTPAGIEVEAKLGKGWHLYSTQPADGPVPTTFYLGEKAIKEVTESAPVKKFDPNFKIDVAYFADAATFKLPGLSDAQAKNLKVEYQLCNDRVCLPPTTVPVVFDGTPAAPAVTATPASPADGDVTGQIAASQRQGLLPFLGLAFGSGLIALLTPCVFPMIPITVSYFSKQKGGEGVKRGRGPVGQAVAYCLGIVGTYTIFGVGVAAIFGGSSIQNFGTNPWVNLALGLLFVYLALNLFGVLQVSLPSGMVNRFSPEGKGGLLAPALMGFTFTLTSFTCAVGFVGAVLGTAASGGSLIYPILGMLAFSSAFALPFFLLALFPSLLGKLPKSGSWMETVKATMGFVEIMAALKFLSNADLVKNAVPLLPRSTFLALWGAIALLAGLYLMGAIRLPSVHEGPKIGLLRRSFGAAFFALTFAFFAAVPGRALGYIDSFLPPGGTAMTVSATGWTEDYAEAQRQSKAANKPMLVNFTGVTCTNCRLMEGQIFPTAEVRSALEPYVLAELYTDRDTDRDKANQALQRKLAGTIALPLYVLVNPDGSVLRKFEGSTSDPKVFAKFLSGS